MITGEDGFIYKNIIDKLKDFNGVFLLGSPTFDLDISINEMKTLHAYVNETIKIIEENKNEYIVFASTTGVKGDKSKHSGTTAYDICKIYLENYIISNCSDYLILRIGTIISDDIEQIKNMKHTRIQQRILKNNLKGIELFDEYLFLKDFIDETVSVISEHRHGIFEYNLTELKLSELIKITKGTYEK